MVPDDDTASRTGTLTDDHGRYLPVKRVELVLTAGGIVGSRHVSKRDRLTVGRHPGSDWTLDDTTVSRFHFEISTSDDLLTIRDLGSRYGTFVNGVSIITAHLKSGDIIRAGRSEMRVELAGEGRIPLSSRAAFGRLVGHSLAMRKTFAVLEKAAGSDSTVLLQGETGTGKDAAAESLHTEGARAAGPFVVLDCAALPAHLLEAELLGYVQGAFTGADRPRTGAMEAASGGTLFIDEIAELPLELQPKLLRAIESKEVQRIGSQERVPVDVRLVAATNRNLREEVNAARFRSDLYYRLAVLEVRLPPLRERLEDLPDLVSALLAELVARPSDAADRLRTPQSLTELARHAWPGNVRELRNYLERALMLPGQVRPEGPAPLGDAPPVITTTEPLRSLRDKWVDYLEKRYLTDLMFHHDTIASAARTAGVDRTYLHRLLARHGLTGRTP